MLPRKNSASGRRTLDPLVFTLVYRLFSHSLCLTWAASVFVVIAAGGATFAQTKAPTVTSISIKANGSVVSSVAAGTVVTLTAQVTAGGANVSTGQVNFCDASAPHCTDIHILGSATLNGSGTATFKFVPGAGAQSYKAQFVEDGFRLGSSSNVASLNVGPAPSPVYSDTIGITADGFAGDYSLTATVTGYGGSASPTGNVSFIDTSFGNKLLATASLGAGVPGIGFLESSSPSFGSNPANEVTADFNSDGMSDLAVLSSNSSGVYAVAVFLGNGDGTFRAGPTIQPSDLRSFPTMISGDFNGDGKPDLAILSYDGNSTSYITILLGNGDGSFSAKATAVVYAQPVTGGDVILGTMAAADFNGDDKLDLAVVGDYVSSGGVTILLGNGDGTFTSAGPNLEPSGDFALIATGDFNGDGIQDFVTPNYFEFGGSPTIFLGKGDGTFTFKKASFTLDYFPTSVVVGDFNSDGVLDLAFADLNGVEIALGNGDGTFTQTSASAIAVPSELYSLQVGDFNHDGKADLAGLDNYNNQIVVLLGAGDGTFAVKAATPTVTTSFIGPNQIAAADFNGDGVPDLALLTSSVNTASILLTVPTETAMATVNHIAPVGPNSHNVDASYVGDSHYSAVTSSTIELTAGLAPLVVTPAAGTYTSEQTLTLTEAIPGSTIYYELTGPANTNGFVQYTGPISLPYGGVEALQAYATETGYVQSNFLLAQYTLNYPAAVAAVFSIASGSYSSAQSLTITDSLTGATIYYTTDGTTPTTSSTQYTGPITVISTETIKAIAVALGYSTSAVTTATYTINTTAEPGVGPGSGGTTSLTVTPGATTGNTATVSVAGTNGFSGIVDLTCSVTTTINGARDMPTCSLNPTSVTISGAAAQTATLTVKTTPASSAANQTRSPFWAIASGTTFALGLLFVRPPKRKDCVAMIGFLFLFVSITGLIGCGGGSSGSGGGGGGGANGGTTPGAYTIMVTGTSGSLNATVGTVTLTVQ
jgi:hypothetical protein